MYYNNITKLKETTQNQKGLHMKFVVTRVSSEQRTIKNFSTINELMHFMEEVGYSLILQDNFWFNEDIEDEELRTIPYEIQIYDDYIE